MIGTYFQNTRENIRNSPDKNSTQANDHWTPSGTILNHKKLQSSCKAPEKSNEKKSFTCFLKPGKRTV